MTKVLKKVDEYTLNKGTLQADGLYNITKGEGKDTEVSYWFDWETKQDLMKQNDEDFIEMCKLILKL
jgi:hypothetical protein